MIDNINKAPRGQVIKLASGANIEDQQGNEAKWFYFESIVDGLAICYIDEEDPDTLFTLSQFDEVEWTPDSVTGMKV